MRQRLGLCLEPLDVLFFRENRPFGAGMRGLGGLPLPQTLAGALRTHLWRQMGLDFTVLATQMQQRQATDAELVPLVASLLPAEHAWAASIKVRGPWLYSTSDRDPWREVGPLVPMPGDLALLGKKGESKVLIRLHPRQEALPGWHGPQDGMVPFWHAEDQDFERADGYLTLSGLGRYVRGEVPEPAQRLQADTLYAWEHRVGITIEAARNRAADQMLYAVRLLRLLPHVAFYAEVEVEAPQATDIRAHLAGTVPFGGEGRRVQVTVLSDPVCWPQVTTTDSNTLAVLLTPGIFGLPSTSAPEAPPWRPERPDLPSLRAAAVPGFREIAGWDLARRHAKPTRFAVVEGSVYCFAGAVAATPGSPFLHLHHGELDTLGYGLALKGMWRYA